MAVGSSRARKGAKRRSDRWKPPSSLGRRRAREAPEESLCLLLALGDLEGVRLGAHASTGLPEKDEEGIVCFITVAGFLNGPGFERMRDDLRRTCSEIWVIDCSPEGHQPEVATRIFQGVQQPVCIVLAARKLGKIDKSRRGCGFARYRKQSSGRSLPHSMRCRSMIQGGSVVRRAGATRSSPLPLDYGLRSRHSRTCSYTMALA